MKCYTNLSQKWVLVSGVDAYPLLWYICFDTRLKHFLLSRWFPQSYQCMRHATNEYYLNQIFEITGNVQPTNDDGENFWSDFQIHELSPTLNVEMDEVCMMVYYLHKCIVYLYSIR